MGLFDRFKKKNKNNETNVDKSIDISNSIQDKPLNNVDEDVKSNHEFSNTCVDRNDFDSSDETDFKILNELVHSGNRYISFDSDFMLESESETVLIDVDNIVIDGNNHIIDGNEKTQIFEIRGNNVTLKNIHFKNGKRAIDNIGTCKIINCIFENNYVENFQGLSMGGAILNYNKGICSLEKCTFKNNGIIRKDSQGGAIFNAEFSKLYIDDCIFEENKSDGGGVLYSKGLLKISDCEFKNNYAYNGSVLYLNSFREKFLSTADVEDCKFEENIAEYNALIFNVNSYVIISKSIFNENTVLSHGRSYDYESGYLIKNRDSEFHIHKCEFKNTKSSETKFILQRGSENVKFSLENSIVNFKREGGLKLIDGFAYISNTKFMLHDFNPEKYLVSNENAILKVSNLKFFDFTDKIDLNYGDIIENTNLLEIDENKDVPVEYMDSFENHKGFSYLDNLIHECSGEITLDCDILIHDLEKDFYEGGIIIDVDNLTIDGQNHTINARNLSRIFIIEGKDIKLKNIKFTKGKYFRNYFDDLNGGGAIYSQQNSSVVIENCEFIDNISLNTSGAIFNNGHTEILGSKFINNEAKQVNDILNNGGSLNVENCCFNKDKRFEISDLYNCHFLNKNELTFKNCNFKFTEFKYILYNIKNYATLNLIDCNFTKSEGDFSDVINYNILKINNSTFTNANGRALRGAIKNEKNAVLYLNYSELHKLRDNISNRYFDVHEKGMIKVIFDTIPVNNESGDYLEYLISTSNEIVLENDFFFKDRIKNHFIVLENVIIDGCGHEISGDGLSDIFEVIGDNVTLKNIRFKNANKIINDGTLNILECYFENIGEISNCKQINMKDCMLNEFSVSNKGDFNIIDSSFENGSRIENLKKGNFNIIGCLFENGPKIINMGGIFNSEKTVFKNYDESVIYNAKECILKEVTFEDNFKEDLISQGGNTHVTQCDFRNNVKRDTFSIKNNSFIEIIDSNFKSNIKGENSNAILNGTPSAKAVIENCNFKYKNKDVVYNNGEISIKSCKFKYDSKINNTGVIKLNANDKNLINKVNGGELEFI